MSNEPLTAEQVLALKGEWIDNLRTQEKLAKRNTDLAEILKAY